MVAETGAKTGIMPADEVCLAWLKEKGIRDATPVVPDADASYERTWSFDIASLEPQVASPHQVDNVSPVSDVRGVKIAMAFLGTCTNGRLEDLAVAAQILKGKKVRPGVVLVIAPASREVMLEACNKGYIQTLVESGGMLNVPGCGPCVGALGGIPPDGANVISTANRNFLGRMGNVKAAIYLSSPATLAASCLTGEITDPRESFFDEALRDLDSDPGSAHWRFFGHLPPQRSEEVQGRKMSSARRDHDFQNLDA